MDDVARVLVLYTGGTIGMRGTERGYAPAPGYLGDQLSRLPQFHEPGAPPLTTPVSKQGKRIHYDIHEYAPLLDSANVGVEEWARIATDIGEHYDDYGAFVVLHGTDTMAYTASALSFMLENLGKTVVLTGSQIPLAEHRNDAIDNLLGALTIAGHYEIPEVCIYFHNRLLRGNRAQKQDAAGLDAFRSGNLGPLVEVGVDIRVDWERVRAPPTAPLAVHTRMSRDVAALRMYPGITAEIIENFLRPPLRGLVIETFGSGNAPDQRPDFLAALRGGTERGVVIVSCTQCHRGTVNTAYAAGQALHEVGVVGGADMTPEAALTKLSHLLGLGLEPAKVAELMQRDLRGELSAPGEPTRFSARD